MSGNNKKKSSTNDRLDASAPKPLDEKGALSIFTGDEIDEFRRELAKRSEAIKRRINNTIDKTS